MYSILLDHTDGKRLFYYCAFHNDFIFFSLCAVVLILLNSGGTLQGLFDLQSVKNVHVQVKHHVLTTKILLETHDQRYTSEVLCLTSVCTLVLVRERLLGQSANVKMSFCFEKVCYISTV